MFSKILKMSGSISEFRSYPIRFNKVVTKLLNWKSASVHSAAQKSYKMKVFAWTLRTENDDLSRTFSIAHSRISNRKPKCRNFQNLWLLRKIHQCKISTWNEPRTTQKNEEKLPNNWIPLCSITAVYTLQLNLLVNKVVHSTAFISLPYVEKFQKNRCPWEM